MRADSWVYAHSMDLSKKGDVHEPTAYIAARAIGVVDDNEALAGRNYGRNGAGCALDGGD